MSRFEGNKLGKSSATTIRNNSESVVVNTVMNVLNYFIFITNTS